MTSPIIPPMTVPPTGVGSLPANRYVLFADTGNRVQIQDESARVRNDEGFSAHWSTGSLNGLSGAPWRIATLISATLFYFADEASTITVRASGDGGENWTAVQVFPIEESRSGMRSTTRALSLTGRDLRLRISFDTDTHINLVGLRAVIVPGGGPEYGQ